MESIFRLGPEQQLRVSEEIGALQTITEFCSSLLEKSKDLPFKEKLVQLLPWAAKGGKLVGEIAPLANVLIKLVDEITKEQDPEKLGLLACSLAYQRSAALALAQQGEPEVRVPFQNSLEDARKQLGKLEAGWNLTGFSLEAPLAHPFVWKADESLSLVVRSSGYSDAEWRQIQLYTHDQFRADLVEILSHGESAPRFEPFTKRLSLSDNSTAAYAAINAHLERQRWLFNDRPVLNTEPFTLSDVYVDTDCGKLEWIDFPAAKSPDRAEPGKRFDPFSEAFGGRHPLLDAVLEYMRDPKFNDAIVIQGAPGCGKSSFTLHLANVLRREGLRPLRIRLRSLDLKKDLSDALAQVVLQPEEDEDPSLAGFARCPDPFLNGSIFSERTRFGDAEISPYVLILDGWDEISVAVNEGFEIEVRRMLDSVRREFLRVRAPKVRVILTGRPSAAVERSLFLKDRTPLLTIREYTPGQLGTYAGRVKAAIDHSRKPATENWPVGNWANITNAIASYREDPKKLEILSLPLLAHLALRLLAEWEAAPGLLLSNRTALYRHLLDVTCPKAGKDQSEPEDVHGQARITGSDLRRMLHQTAIAITTFGSESIPFQELRLRLRKSRKEAMVAAESAGKDHPLTSLMISFYFKGGKEHLGCEFLHKSFREYLYAESIVEALKDYGRKPSPSQFRRDPYWKDFQESDPRRPFSRELCQILCPQPLTREIWSHIQSLIEWEIQRPGEKQSAHESGQPLPPCTPSQWENIRDALADLWDWWGEGVHLRPQPFRDDSENLQYRPALVNELLDSCLPRDRGHEALDWWPCRLVNVDANLGDSLCRLNACIHACILRKGGWKGIRDNQLKKVSREQRPYQSYFEGPSNDFVLFRPTGSSAFYFHNYCSRINAAGIRPNGPFPREIDLRLADLDGTFLKGADLVGTVLDGASLSHALLDRASLSNVGLAGADLSGAYLDWANLSGAYLGGADLNGAYLAGADLKGADLRGAVLREADLRGADLRYIDLDGADLSGARLDGANIEGVNFERVYGTWLATGLRSQKQ
jgi:hypothetical protein